MAGSEIAQESKWTKSHNDLSVKMGWYPFPPERVKLTVNTKKETNSRVKMGQESKWASVIYPLKESKWAKGQDGLTSFTT